MMPTPTSIAMGTSGGVVKTSNRVAEMSWTCPMMRKIVDSFMVWLTVLDIVKGESVNIVKFRLVRTNPKTVAGTAL
jgi:hypothetical protein